MGRRVYLVFLAIGLTVLIMGCSVGEIIVKVDTPTPTTTKTARPTFTPDPPATATPLPTNTPSPIPPTPTHTVTLLPTTPPLPTDTSTPVATNTPVPPPTPTSTVMPVGVTIADNLNFRAGPSTAYASLGKLPKGTRLEIRTRLADSSWLRACCFQDQEGWVATQFVELNVPLDSVPVDASVPPTPTRAPTQPPKPPTDTPVPAPSYRFTMSHKEEFPTSNDFLDIGVRITNGQNDNFLPGFKIKLINTTHGKEYLSKASVSSFFWTDMEGSGAAKKANVNFDRIPLPGASNWIMYVTDDAGNRLSADVTFSAEPSQLKYYFVFVGS